MFFLLACSTPAPSEGTPAPVAGPAARPTAAAPAAAPAPAASELGPAKPGEVRATTVTTLKASLDAGKVPLLVDVRTPAEFGEGHVPGAKNVPLDQVEARLTELGAPGEVWLICRSGGRSAHASTLLAKNGYAPVNVEGGTTAWTAAGYAVER